MKRVLARATLRHHRRRPWQAGLALLGVALGVAVVVSIDLATDSAREAFRRSAEAVAGRTTHRVVAGPAGVPEEVFVALRTDAGIRSAAPVVESWTSSPLVPGRPLRLLGVDPFSEAPARPALTAGEGLDVAALLTRPGAAYVSAALAASAGLEPGDPLPLEVGGRTRTLRIAGVLRPPDELARRGLDDVVVVDVAEAQDLLNWRGRLSRIDLVLPEGQGGEAVLDDARSVLPAGVRIEEAGARAGTFAEMVRAFDLNLTALGLLALLFGAFLIYNTVTFSVVQRRELLGALRAVGVTRREIATLIVGEAVALGVAGSALGLALGTLLGRGLVRLVTRTINDLYFVVSVKGVALAPEVLLRGGVLGLAATVLAAVPAVREATATPPRATLTRSFLEERIRTLVPRVAWVGVGLAAAGAALLLVPSRSVVLGFASLFGLVFGAALLTPLAVVGLSRGAAPLFRRAFGAVGAMAARGVEASLSRTAPAAAALVVAVAVAVGLGVMISSFRSTVEAWLDRTLEGDVYVSVPGPASGGPEGTIEPSAVEGLVGMDGVAGATLYRNVALEGRYGRVRLVAVEHRGAGGPGVAITRGAGPDPEDAMRAGRAVLVSEPFAFRHGVDPGQRIFLETAAGERALPVAGVYRDYGSDRGTVMVSRERYRSLWDDDGVSSLALVAAEGVAPEVLVARARERGTEQRLVVRSHRDLRRASLEVFDRTFAITRVLRVLAFVVAFVGMLGALTALQLERGREMGLLRAGGVSRTQVGGLVAAETGLLGAITGLVALPVGLVLAVVLVHVVNRRSFGWTLDLAVGWEMPLETMALAVSGALLAAAYPAWKMARTSPARALKEE